VITKQLHPRERWTRQKTEEEIDNMKEGGRILREISKEVLSEVKRGVTLKSLDDMAEKLIKKYGKDEEKNGVSFKTVPGYDWATCINVNNGVVHGIPHNNIRLREGDIVSLDIGFIYKKLHTDLSETIHVGKVPKETSRFLKIGRKVLGQAIEQCKLGNRTGHISQAIEQGIKGAGYRPVSVLVGHAIGEKLHELPSIPCVLNGPIEKTNELEERWTLSIEVIYTKGKPDVSRSADGWTIQTQDGKIAGLFEETVAVTKNGPKVLTH